jgi:3-hydroxyacyl-[acyl-carrier-protein] dehydratase
MNQDILDRIPQRDPFLFIQDIVDRTEKTITTSYQVTGEEDFFKGHFPANPIMPGVLLSEACFQTGALLMSYLMDGGLQGKTAVVSRIQGAKFKNMVRPGDKIQMQAELTEQVGPAAYLKAKITCQGKTVMTIEFACTLVEN